MSEHEDNQIQVAALCGSLRENSLTAAALRIALEGAKQFGATVEFVDLRDYHLPFHAGVTGSHDSSVDVMRLKHLAKASDAVILGTPEYHGSFSGVLKNALDFLTFDEMEGKMIGLVGVSGGAMGAFDALNGLRSVGRALHAWVLPQQVAIPEAFKVFDGDGRILDPELAQRLRTVGTEAARFAHLHKCGRLREFLQIWETAPVNPGGALR
jgi:NAD(P)H-dependent FMN reductase